MEHPLLYRIALTLVPNIGPVVARLLLQHLSPEEIFTEKKALLERIEGVGKLRVDSIRRFKDFARVEAEIAFIEKHRVTPLFLTDTGYPQRLLNCYDAPVLLYYKGNADLNQPRIIAVVGSRSHTEYGKLVCERLVDDLRDSGALVISGLAYGIDSLVHRHSLKAKLQTVGVLAHGLDKIYPADHFAMAREMTGQGGLLTEFVTGTQPDRHHFPSRNRIVAGISDATVVVETEVKGGSMITAELANGYHKDVFAFPGRTLDKKSSGCNCLIRTNRAQLLTDGKQLLETMGWEPSKKPVKKQARELFIELSAEEQAIVTLLQERQQADIDELHLRSGLSSSRVAVAVLNLEMQQVIQALPGKVYQLL
ncbi:DNA-processing protein DprA [Niabella drilacis]|uniref:DNA processing protein n=1 Tax=Niabella drilacis (strain DSM 25811 / CCM 8410 / CCUG 62505 / LMG 26954 / E90) TaxID=1285928 RepID=A0A1G6VRZ7_NIADE|nr:DNA-processing protein DprA [Niabella drilacis]SDD55625.1 DNA processing protein [Niabella drilacis]